MSNFHTPAYRMTLFPGQKYRKELPDLVRTYELAHGADGVIEKTSFAVDTTPAPNTEISGVFHLLLWERGDLSTTRTGRYAVMGDGRNKMLWITHAFAEWHAPIQNTMPHAWLAALDPLPPLQAPAPQQVAALTAEITQLDPQHPACKQQLQDLYTRIAALDPWHAARSSRAAVAWLPVHMAQFVPGVRISLPHLVYANGKPHPEPVTLIQLSGSVAIVTAHDGQGMTLKAADLSNASVLP